MGGGALGALELDTLEIIEPWPYLIGVASFSYAAEVCMTCGYALAGSSIGQVSVLEFLSPIFSIAWGALFLSESIASLDMAGAFLVIGSSMIIVYTAAGSQVPHCSDEYTCSERDGNFDVFPDGGQSAHLKAEQTSNGSAASSSCFHHLLSALTA